MEDKYSGIIVNDMQTKDSNHKDESEIVMTHGYPVMCFSTDGLDIIFCIKGYQAPYRPGFVRKLCKVDVEISAEGRMNICRQDMECLLSSEIDGLLESINRVRISQTDIYHTESYNEQDMSFDLTNVDDGRNNRVVSGRWDIAINKQGLSSHYISINLSHKNIELLRAYLLLVTGMRTDESFEVNRWIRSKNIIV